MISASFRHTRLSRALFLRMVRPRLATHEIAATCQLGQRRGLHGVKRVLQASREEAASSTLLENEFSLTDRVALVTGARRGLDLEGALALAEAGARAVYCVDIGDTPGTEWTRVQEYVSRMGGEPGERRLEYVRGDVSDQERMWEIGKMVGDREGRMDVCFAAAGITGELLESLRIPESELQDVLDVNLKGPLFTAQAAGQQMERFGNGGSIMLVSSILGNISVNFGITCYEMAKSGVQQLGRSLACELAPKGIRVNSISPGIYQTPMVDEIYRDRPDLPALVRERNPMKRIGEPHEIRGAVVWLASDASSFCTGSDIAVDGGHRAC